MSGPLVRVRPNSQLEIILFLMANAHPDRSITHIDEIFVSIAKEEKAKWIERVEAQPLVELSGRNKSENAKILSSVAQTLRVIDYPSPYCP